MSWDLIENAETGRRVLLRMGLDENGIAITGLYVPGPRTIGIGELRTVPFAAIEAAVRNRRARAGALVQAAVMAGPNPHDGPLGRPESPDDMQFFARLAMRYMRVAETSKGPATDLAKAEGVTPRTIQRGRHGLVSWVCFRLADAGNTPDEGRRRKGCQHPVFRALGGLPVPPPLAL